MNKLRWLLPLLIVCSTWSVPAFAQCARGLLVNCPPAVDPLATDFVYGWQNAENPHSRKFTLSQLMTAAGGPGAPTYSVQYNNNGVFGGISLGLNQVPLGQSLGAPVAATLGTAAFFNIGTAGSTIPLLNTNNTFSGNDNFTGSVSISGVQQIFPPSGLLVGTTDTQTLTNKSINASEVNSGVLAVANGGTGLASGTSGGVLAFTASGVLASSGTLTQFGPILGGGAGAVPTAGSRKGNTTIFATTNGAFVTGDCMQADGNGNIVDAGGPCGGGGGSGTVTAGTANQLAYYASSGTTVAGLSSANNGVLVTNGSGVPSISTTLPNGLAMGTPASLTLTNATGTPASLGLANATGTPSSINLTNGSALPISGITGLGTGVGTALAASVSGSGGIVLATSATLTSPTLVTAALGTPTALVLTHATGLPNAGLINPSTTVNGQTCTLGSSCTITATAGSITVGSTTVSGGTTGRIEYNNAGTLGELATSGSGNVALTTSPTFTTPNLGTPSTLVLTNATGLPNSGLINTTITVNSTVCTLGSSCSPTATATSVTVGTTTVASGTNGDIEYNNGGTLGEKGVTGTGNVVLATSPTLVTPALGTPSALVLTNATGLPNAGLINASTTVNGVVCTLGSTCAVTATAASITPGSTTIVGGTSGAVEYNNAGTLGELTPTGTGNVVLATGPTIASPTITGTFTATGLVSNADLVNPSVTVNGTTCTLGSSCSPSATATSVTVGTTTVLSGTSGDVLYNNAGVMGNLATTGSGNVVRATSPTLTTPALGTPSALVLTNATGLPNSGLLNPSTTVNGQTCTLGSTCTITATAGTITVGTTAISGGTSGRIEYNNAGLLGELTTTGSGNVVLSTSPALTTPNLGTPSAVNLTNATAVPAAQLTGIVATTNGGAGTINGALAGNGSGTVSRAACAGLSNAGTGCSTNTGTSGATIPLLNGSNTWSAGQSVAPSVLTFGSTITPNAALSNNFTVTVTGSFTMANPTNLQAGQTMNFWITQDSTGGRVASWGSAYQASGGAAATLILSTAANAKDLVSCQSDTTSTMTCSIQTAIH
jgi:hypothetical protein